MKLFLCTLIISISFTLQSQDTMDQPLPYATITKTLENYTPGTVIARMVDGLGFRYYWATAELTDKDLNYAPANNGRTINETLTHIYSLTEVILNSAKKQATNRASKASEMTFAETRKATLENLQTASKLFAATENLSEHTLIFKRSNGESEFPFWNAINGPIEDAVWHAGQVVVLRRIAGNPINPKVNVFLGKLND